MDFKQIEAFVAVIEHHSFSRAAESLFLTQPTISSHITHLEHELGVKLLSRNTRDLNPTEAGEQLFSYAKQLLALRDEAISAVAVQQDNVKTVLLAASTVPATSYLPRLTADFRQDHPSVVFQVLHGNSNEAEAMLLSGKAELAFAGQKPHSSRCIAAPFAQDKLVVITPNTPRYQALQGSVFPLAMLLTEPYVGREKGSGTRYESEEFLRSIGIDPEDLHVAVETRSTDSAKKMVSEGLGISIVSEAACADYVDFGKVLRFSLGGLTRIRQLYVLRLRNGIISREAREFFEYVKGSAK